MIIFLTSHPIQYQSPLWRRLAQTTDLAFQVWYLTPHGATESFDREFGQAFAWDIDLYGGFDHRFLGVRPGWDMKRFFGIRMTDRWEDLLRQNKVTHLWIEGWRFAEFWQAAFAASKLGIKVWLRGETNDLRKASAVRVLPRRLALSRLFSRVDAFFCIGTANRRFYEGFGVSSEKLYAAPYCVDNDSFARAAEARRPDRAALRARWGIEDGAFCFLFCGKFIAKKRPLDLLAAAALQRGRPIHLLMVGSGELQSALTDAANTLARTHNGHAAPVVTTFTGFLNQSEIVDAYVAADALVLPSDAGETWGLVVNEALACGTPAIASDLCGSTQDLVAPTGPFAYRCGDVSGLAGAMTAMMAMPPSAETLARAISAHHFDCTIESIQTALRFTK